MLFSFLSKFYSIITAFFNTKVVRVSSMVIIMNLCLISKLNVIPHIVNCTNMLIYSNVISVAGTREQWNTKIWREEAKQKGTAFKNKCQERYARGLVFHSYLESESTTAGFNREMASSFSQLFKYLI